MRRSLLCAAVTLMIAGACFAQTTVTPQTILEIQPFVDDLNDLFPSTATDVFVNNGYTYAGRFRNDIAPYDAVRAKQGLESSHGLLLFGSHGSSDGSIGIEVAPNEPSAITRKNFLVQLRIFAANELDVGQTDSGLWIVTLTPQYTNNHPASCDVAIIADCWGAASIALSGMERATAAKRLQAASTSTS